MTPHERHLDTAHVGRRILTFDELPSTNDAAAELALDPANSGTVVIARHQTAGRGQYGRTWASRPDASLLMSVVLFPPASACRPVVLTAWAAVAIGDAIYDLTATQAKIKWPNDLLIRGQKCCGILIEHRNAGGTVVGIGLNLNQTPDDFAAAGLPAATSLTLVGGRELDLHTAADAAIRRLDSEYSRLLADEFVALEADWKWRIGLLGKDVLADLADGSRIAGRLLEMSFSGLEIERPDGGIETLAPETVRQLRADGP